MSAGQKETSKPINISENQQSGHRKIGFSVESGELQFFLKIPDTRHTWNFIPLGTVPSAAKGAHPKAVNITVPVIPLCYTTPDCDPQKAALPRPGWLYVFREGKLWREFAVTNTGYYSDVNLKENQKNEVRQATGTFDSRVQLPYKEAGQTQTIEMAFSEVQWSWARINKLQSDSDLRRQRMQQIDLSGYGANFPTLPGNGNKARVENIKNAPPIYHLGLQRESNIPVVYLHDPLGVANSLAETHETAWADMEILIESLRSGIRPTELERRSNLGSRPPKPSPEEKQAGKQIAAQFEVAVLMQQIGFASEKNTKAYGQHLNQGHLDVLLGRQVREQQRRKISDSKIKLADFLGTGSYQTALAACRA